MAPYMWPRDIYKSKKKNPSTCLWSLQEILHCRNMLRMLNVSALENQSSAFQKALVKPPIPVSFVACAHVRAVVRIGLQIPCLDKASGSPCPIKTCLPSFLGPSNDFIFMRIRYLVGRRLSWPCRWLKGCNAVFRSGREKMVGLRQPPTPGRDMCRK